MRAGRHPRLDSRCVILCPPSRRLSAAALRSRRRAPGARCPTASRSRPTPPRPRRAPRVRPAGATAPTLLLCGARLTDGRTVDVRLGGGRIEAVGTAGSLTAHSARAWTSPAICSCRPRPSPTRTATRPCRRTATDRSRTRPRRSSAVRPRPRLLQLGHGATALRSHVRVGDVQGLGSMARGAPGAARAARAGRVDGGGDAAGADRARRGRRAGDAAGRGEDGRLRSGRLSRSGP